MGFFKKIKKIFSSKKTDQKDLKKQSDPAKEELLSKKINQEEGIANQIKSYDSKWIVLLPDINLFSTSTSNSRS